MMKTRGEEAKSVNGPLLLTAPLGAIRAGFSLPWSRALTFL